MFNRKCFRIIRYTVGYFIPSYKRCPLHFLRDILNGKKRVFKTLDVFKNIIPDYDELAVIRIWLSVKDNQLIASYFLDYEGDQLSDRSFFFSILATIFSDETQKLIVKAREKRSTYDKEEKDNLVEVENRIKEELVNVLAPKRKDLFVSLIVI